MDGPPHSFLLAAFHHHYPPLFAVTLIPGLIAAALIAFVVKEKERKPVSHVSFGERLRAMPGPYRKFLLAVGLFGSGDFAHTMLILLATQKLAPVLGQTKAASFAVAFYDAHNVFYASSAPISGWLSDRFKKTVRPLRPVITVLGAVMAILIIFLPATIWTFVLVFVFGGIYVGVEETLEDSLCAELVEEEHHGTGRRRRGQPSTASAMAAISEPWRLDCYGTAARNRCRLRL